MAKRGELKSKRIKFNCEYCKKEYELIERVYLKRKRFNCDDPICVKRGKSHPGKLNHMYGKTHTDKVKKEQSLRAKEMFSGDTYEERYGEETSIKIKKKRSTQMKNDWKSGKIVPDKRKWDDRFGFEKSKILKENVGKKSKEKFTPEYKLKQRKIMEERGIWIPLSQKSDWKIYTKEANWIARMWDIIPNGLNLIDEFGVFSRKNTKGIVRDHIYSRKSGFQNGVFPVLLRHPVNCNIITHADNVKKKTSRYIDKDGHSLYELFDKIRNYDLHWIEQNLCLSKIEEYENGKRWFNQHK